MPQLFDPLTIKNITLRNRIGLSPMCQYQALDSKATDWHLAHLGARAVGGAGLIITEATAVEPRGRISAADLGLWADKQIEPLLRINHFINQHGAVSGIQLAHAGRKAGTPRPWDRDNPAALKNNQPWETIAPSPIPFGGLANRTPKEMTLTDIQRVQAAFRAAAVRALVADYNWMELHAAHGYLLHSFCSPLSNHRSDAYGGSFENRIRFVIETTQTIRSVWPEDRPFSVRLSCTDWTEGGWTLEDSVALARRLKSEGVDVIDCSSGGIVPDVQVPIGPCYQAPFAATIKKEVGILTAAVGLITQPAQADEIIRAGQADIVLLGREMLRNPYWPIHAAHILDQKSCLTYPPEYKWAVE